MKYITYNEFFDKIIKELGYGISTAQCSDGTGTIYITERGTDNTIASIDKKSQYTYDFTNLFFMLSDQERWDLYGIVTLFAGTPYRERFPQKKYKYKLRMVDEMWNYIRINKYGDLVICTEEDAELFTDSEVKRLSEDKQKLFSIADKVEVE